MEAIVLQEPWCALFNDAELATARARLDEFGYFERAWAARQAPSFHVDEERFSEGARMDVSVSVYERDPRAQEACLQRYGVVCFVCGFDFATVYGELGRGFIHVHHLTPFARTTGPRDTDPAVDLRPVCPNCHAMLHRTTPPVSIAELQRRVAEAKRRRAA